MGLDDVFIACVPFRQEYPEWVPLHLRGILPTDNTVWVSAFRRGPRALNLNPERRFDLCVPKERDWDEPVAEWDPDEGYYDGVWHFTVTLPDVADNVDVTFLI